MFAVIGAVYWFVQEITGFHIDFAGTTMLILLGVSMAIMAYVLIAGSPNE